MDETHLAEPCKWESRSVLTVAFELDGQPFPALNGGPDFKFNEGLSFEIGWATQNEVD